MAAERVSGTAADAAGSREGAAAAASAEAMAAAERAARTSYGRLVALLAARSGDLALAEDALSAAFEQALVAWPEDGVPRNPDGWLLTVARNRQRDVWRSPAHRSRAPFDDLGEVAVSPIDDVEEDAIPDRRLELLLVCAHPAIDPAARTPLMLQAVLGIDAARIARAFAVPPAAMAQRLVRAKRRIRDARIPFVLPGREGLAERLPAVLEAVYGCHALERPGSGLDGEARYLAVLLATLVPHEPEAWALAALVTLSSSRRHPGGAYVPLDEQDPRDWDAGLVAEGESYLGRSSSLAPPGPPGRFRLEAAIQAVHCARARTGTTDCAALLTLYRALVLVAPSLGAHVALAGVVGRVEGPLAGLSALEPLVGRPGVDLFQPYWATRAHLLARAGRSEEAAVAYDTAIALADDDAVRAYLLAARDAQEGGRAEPRAGASSRVTTTAATDSAASSPTRTSNCTRPASSGDAPPSSRPT
jgi:RNA polymerase sigma-70 factor, ECF subfamily